MRRLERDFLRQGGIDEDIPAEQAITPFHFSSSGMFAILLYAPRILNEKTGCKSSRFNTTRTPSLALRFVPAVNGVSFVIS